MKTLEAVAGGAGETASATPSRRPAGGEAHPERLRRRGASVGGSGSPNLSEEEREELRARDRERKRRERAKS